MNCVVVIIGRNEGERLRACLKSIAGSSATFIYVDSGSFDGSVELAHRLGAIVVELDPSQAFSAARARNAGAERAFLLEPELEFIQFIDADCAMDSQWLGKAVAFLQANPDCAVACGRRREWFPEASVYNQLCDVEWNTPVGEAKASGGDVMIRVTAFKQVGGYLPEVFAAEDDDICLRMRRAHWKVYRLDAEMTLHDAAMMRFGQWWKRAKRSGQAYAQGCFLNGRSPDRHFVRDSFRLWIWGFAVPLIVVSLAWFTRGTSPLLLLLYPFLAFRIYQRMRQKGYDQRTSLSYAFFTILAKFPGLLGWCEFHLHRSFGKDQKLLEYKDVGAAVGAEVEAT